MLIDSSMPLLLVHTGMVPLFPDADCDWPSSQCRAWRFLL